MVPDLTELTQGHLESRTRHHWGEGQSGAFGVRRAILGRYKVEWERIGGDLTLPHRDRGRHPGG